MNLCNEVVNDIAGIAEAHDVEKVILFGSRARGDNTERSDVDVAIVGGDFDNFYWDMDENINSLLMFDVVKLDSKISQALKQEIERDGVVIYEET
ncbi:MAG: nucleotidyltransferase domain-containing protein [Synergistaceae bacterium]|nr:nucleotidyltransferase domain-containing protein [Synergistaceae bacterium]